MTTAFGLHPAAIVLENAWPLWLLILLVAALMAMSFVAYHRTTGATTSVRRHLLVFMRLALIGVISVGLLHPIVHGTIRSARKAKLVFLLDDSQSMSIADASGGSRRVDAVKQLFDDGADRLRALERSFDVSMFGFGRELSHVEPANLAAGDSMTDIAGALAGVANRFPDKDFRYVVLVSDGVATGGARIDSPVRQLADRSVKVFTVGVGAAEEAAVPVDARVRNIFTSRTAFVDDILPVEVEVTASGLSGATLPVSVLLDGDELETSRFVPEQPFHATRLSFKVKPRREGLAKLTVRIAEQDGELLLENNSASTFVRVSSDALKVLYLDRIRPEYKWLHNALEKAPEVALTNKALVDELSARSSAVVPRTREDWVKYDVIIFGDLPAAYFGSSQLESLADAVSAGCGFLMIAGRHNFGAGKYTYTRVADLLPVTLSEEEIATEPFRVVPTYTGKRLGLLRLDTDEARNEQTWLAAPRLVGLLKFAGTKPSARVLAEDDQGRPVCVVSDYGAGRVMAWGVLSTQPWVFYEEGQWLGYHRRLWRQIMLWLASREAGAGKPVVLVSDRFNFPAGSPVPLQVRVRDKTGNPVPDAGVSATVKCLEDAKSVQYGDFEKTGAYYDRTIEKLAPGTYEVEVTASAAGEVLGSDVSRFIVFEPSYELDVLRPDFANLSRIAASTGGAFFKARYPHQLFDKLSSLESEVNIVRYRRRELWRSVPVFLLLVALVSLEWVMRKRWGLV